MRLPFVSPAQTLSAAATEFALQFGDKRHGLTRENLFESWSKLSAYLNAFWPVTVQMHRITIASSNMTACF
jgi:hypothetical protein